VRLMLVLESMNKRDASARDGWRALLTAAPDDESGAGEHWELRALRLPEALMLVIAWLFCAGVVAWHVLF
jgi:hypothetical protein